VDTVPGGEELVDPGGDNEGAIESADGQKNEGRGYQDSLAKMSAPELGRFLFLGRLLQHCGEGISGHRGCQAGGESCPLSHALKRHSG
jgi:hypothetical protein